MKAARILRVCRQRVRSLFDRDRVDEELGQELGFHFDQLVLENLGEGMNVQEARHAAARTLGNRSILEAQCRDHRRVQWLDDLREDAVYGWRMLLKNPGFTAVTVASLALGIGSNTAIMGALYTINFGSLPYPEADRIVMIRTFPFAEPRQQSNASIPDYFAFKEQTTAFETIGCSLADQKSLGASEYGDTPEKIFGQVFSPGLFESLGVPPLFGRAFTEADYREGPPLVVVLSYRLWQRRFGGTMDIVGQKIALNGTPTEIIGVMPSDFRFGADGPEYWIPAPVKRTPLQAGVRYHLVAARLKRGATISQAQAELDRVAAQLARDFPGTHTGWGVRVQPLREALFGWIEEPLLILESSVLLVLLTACANVAGLLLARGEPRRQEFALRAALGAGRSRIARQVLTESWMLSLAGGALGLVIAALGLRILVTVTPPPGSPRLLDIPLNLRMLLLTALMSLITALAFGAGPALAAYRHDLTRALKSFSPGWSTGGGRQRLRGLLVSVQVALAFVLLIGSGLLIKSYERLAGRDLNFTPQGLLTFEFRLPVGQFLHQTGTYRGFPYMAVNPDAGIEFQRIFDRLCLLPGAKSVAGISNPPINSVIVPTLMLSVEGAVLPAGETSYFLVMPNLFATLGTPFVRGRDFDRRDTAGARWVAVINETAARRFWPGEDPLGKRFTLDSVPDDQPREVIGVVRDIPTRTRSIGPEPVVYASYLQQPLRYRLPWATLLGQMTFVVRTQGDPLLLAPDARRAVAEIDPNIPIANVIPMERYTQSRLHELLFYTVALGVFASLAVFLAVLGIYGALAYAVARRTHEIGVRVSVGASPLVVVRLVAQRTILLTGIGLLTGIAGAVVFLSVAALSACVGPLRRAMRMDPVMALRSD